MLAGDDAKLSKSATLRKAIEHIEQLEAENSALRTDLDRLRLILKAHRIELPQRAQSPLSMSPVASGGGLSPTSLSPTQSPPLQQKGTKRPRMDQILERPLPTAGFDMLISVIWQVIRHALNGLWIGCWFSRRRRDEGKPVTVVCKSHAHTALVYHKLHQLHLMGVDETYGGVSGLYLALSAVNLAESAGASTDGLPRSVMAYIYAAAGLRTRMCLLSPFSKIVSSYFFRRARRHIRRAEESSVNGLVWMYHPMARKFLSNGQNIESILKGKDLRLSPFIAESIYSSINRLRAHFKLHLLSELAGELTGRLDHRRRCDVHLVEGDS